MYCQWVYNKYTEVRKDEHKLKLLAQMWTRYALVQDHAQFFKSRKKIYSYKNSTTTKTF